MTRRIARLFCRLNGQHMHVRHWCRDCKAPFWACTFCGDHTSEVPR